MAFYFYVLNTNKVKLGNFGFFGTPVNLKGFMTTSYNCRSNNKEILKHHHYSYPLQYCFPLSDLFLAVTIEWQWHPEREIKVTEQDSVNSLKRSLNRGATVLPKYYYSGNRKFQILHTRLRTNCSSLSNDLFLKNI